MSDSPTSAAPIILIPTADGARIAVKHRPNPDAPPVIFVHGLAVNADLWDLPEIRGADFHYRSLASILHDRGYDVWLMNLRGHGGPRMLSEPAPGQQDWCIDHFILDDLPAVVDHVHHETRRRPFIIAASMGAMTLAGYAQGARRTGAGGDLRITADPERARRRQALLAGAVFAEFPAALRWPASLYDAQGRLRWDALLRDWWRTDGGANFPFEMLSRWGWLQALVSAAGGVPLDWLRHSHPDQPWYANLPAPLAEACRRLERRAVQAMLNWAGTFTGATHHRAEVMLQGRRYVMDHMKAGVLEQLAACVRARAFISHLGSPPHVYSEHYDALTLPLLVVQGGRDRIASPEVTRAAFFDRVASADKTFLFDPDVAHGEVEAAPVACERLYPPIRHWLDERAERGAESPSPGGAG
jgi:alpha-beta hydrolase superfamily lysophospholipase